MNKIIQLDDYRKKKEIISVSSSNELDIDIKSNENIEDIDDNNFIEDVGFEVSNEELAALLNVIYPNDELPF